jgi:hypothetical protein
MCRLRILGQFSPILFTVIVNTLVSERAA